ncbi:MAG: Prophage antirepressor [Candidatus Daviesbacteria bacterium GW2011_GWA1_41_61]|uniref:Prophage antirepressor n=1 Tax=Candidatus Daviesbacteria bacterium GW2011_GWA2_40_9 TaxID=1618424 RepID=A0A0G0U1G6_9BACT|nr:MAG: Prophage antirepressor [Candidatus Daviesbacteria bacterium GW2011_GWC1_40_9]KKR82953.1 MAG: Prophage antirepressor [Candidatus Daviesbacteria bacterium GW2011_GWA2_40_9]KKR92880.1 MAG: Prophage antirepressor [Candidatus Daviesbacteria bacterium GW2011_GWB1_41_15]KKS15424.1 MAG: Prophage antirepressor [Candidatus Daviesbacteria bacterium GW2011_GWA1_41_61]
MYNKVQQQFLTTMNQETAQTTKIAIFRNRKIRKTIYQNEWWFVITDVIAALTDSQNPKQYLKNMLNRDDELAKGWVQIEHPLLIETSGGKQKVRCANTEGIFRIIQSIPSPKAEPFKRWLARVGYERVQEIEDPELAQKRARALYKAKGYPEDWIERRMRSIAIREELTDEWQKHGVELAKEYEILTAEISKATFGVTPSEYKKIKGLKRQNLRDHMSDLELLFSQLGEAATTEITKTEHPRGFEKNKKVSRRGGKIAGDARSNLERETGRKVITSQNYLPKEQNKKLQKK